MRNGTNYFVQQLDTIDEAFANVLGSLMSVIGKHLKIKITCNNKKPFNDVSISKVYGDFWKQEKNHYEINLLELMGGVQKDFIF